MDIITGSVERFLYKNPENHFGVFTIRIEKNQTIVARGYASGVQEGSTVELHGKWTMHAKFGKQFEASNCITSLPQSIDGLKKYLGSGIIKGIGKVYAEKLVHTFGLEILTTIEKTPEKLSQVPGIGQKRIEEITKSWQEQKHIAHIMVFLQDKGASSAYATKIYKHYGTSAISIMTENPYRIAQEVWGIGFKIADTIAQKLGFTQESIARIKAGILFTINQETTNGHLYVELETLKKLTLTILELNLEKVKESLSHALYQLHHEKHIALITHQEKHYITLSKYYWIEKNIAKKINDTLSYTVKTFNHHDSFDLLQKNTHNIIELTEQQQEGILRALEHKVSIITGGPGTGKTTLVKQLLKILDEKKLRYKLAAPTGRAAKRITESTGKYAVTLHRLLEFNPQIMGFTHNEQNALDVDFLIIDESSMIDVFLAHAIFKALPLTAHILFLGDIDQLPSVGAGNFLQDLIISKKITTTRLKYIFRQAENSLIAYNAHRINQGNFPESQVPQTIQDYYFIKDEHPENLHIHLKKILFTLLPKYKISKDKSVVLCPMNRGSAGTQTLNEILQTMLNPESTSVLQKQFQSFKTGDRVMQIKNNYDKHVFNGDIGTIKEINHADTLMTIEYPDKDIVYDFLETDELILAYSISIHKSQGSEFDAVIIPIFTQHFALLQRNLIYTAMTRAKKLCIFIGQPKALAMAIKNIKSNIRITFLSIFLNEDLQCR